MDKSKLIKEDAVKQKQTTKATQSTKATKQDQTPKTQPISTKSADKTPTTNPSKSHITMTDVQKPKAGQAVAIPITKSTTKKSPARKKRPAAQLRAGKKIQALPSAAKISDTAKSTDKTKTTTKAQAYREITLGGATKQSRQPSPVKNPDQIRKAEIVTNGSLPISKIAPKKMHLSFFRKIHLRPSQIVAGVVVLLLAAFFGRVAIWEHFYLIRMEGSERHTTGTEIAEDNAIIEEDEWSEERKDAYQVPADMPRFLSIPSIGIYRSPIMQVGVNARGEMATPPYLYNVGWYTGSSLPGTNGVSVIDGHGGPYSNAVFENLPSLAVGAEIIVEMGDGRIFNYYVADLANLPIGDEANNYMNTAFRSPQTGRGSLTLITCTGDWVVRDNIRTYSHRLFVRALLDPAQSAAAPAVKNPTPSVPQVPSVPRPSTPNPPVNNPDQSGDKDQDQSGDKDPTLPDPDPNPDDNNQGNNSGNGNTGDNNTGDNTGGSNEGDNNNTGNTEPTNPETPPTTNPDTPSTPDTPPTNENQDPTQSPAAE